MLAVITFVAGVFAVWAFWRTGVLPAENTVLNVSDQREQPPIENVSMVRIYLDGRLTLDDSDVSPHELENRFAKISQKNGALWIYVEGGNMEMLPNSRSVIEAAGKVQIPFLFSTEENFSDVDPEDTLP